ncbi:unnamed protein product [Phyllotreta striolata]|uniref:PROP1-like PPR domain-containing protein n=1 Tax=Phyllotreta striolata TaxID=444603 RepID=A0A9N9XU12_PHYSR|nr:unnamed protein product [Phyllotreta striolata]
MNIFKVFKAIRFIEKSTTISNCSQLRFASVKTKINNIDKSTKPDSECTEEEVLVKLKTDPDTFGSPSVDETLMDDDLKEEMHFIQQSLPTQKLRIKAYADMITGLIRKRKIKEAIDVLEVRMLKEDKVKPEGYIYNLLLGACGRLGYTKKAFMLYNDMKRRGMNVMGGTYTALFNACANSPWPLTDGLSRANHLRNLLIEKGYEPNDTNYNAMIKAFGRCGDHLTAFSIVDEMLSKGMTIKDDTFNFLLQACITDKEAGFRHALLVWRKLLEKNVNPTIYTFNLLLRTVRDCGIGDVEVTKDVIESICNKHNLLTNGNSDKLIENQRTESVAVCAANIRPNLLAHAPHMGNVVSLTEIKEPEHRLLLLGGCNGFLDIMKHYDCKPDVKTFSQLLNCLPGTITAEKELLNHMKKANVKPDLDFFNMLLKKRSLRHDYNSAKEVLELMSKHRYKPNLFTYGILALGCTTKNEAIELLDEMKAKSYTLNTAILGAMLHQACYHFNYVYVLFVMEECIKSNVQPNPKFMKTLEEFKATSQALYKEDKLNKNLHKHFGIFKRRYKTWLQEVEVDESENEHPWKQFREPQQQEYKYKSSDSDTARFKARHTSLFKVKTVNTNVKPSK